MDENFEKINKQVSAFIIVSAALAIPSAFENAQAQSDVSLVKPQTINNAVAKYGIPVNPSPIRIQHPVLKYGVPVRPVPESNSSKADLPVVKYDASELPAEETNKYFDGKKLNSDEVPDDTKKYFENKRHTMENKFYKQK